MRQRIEIGLQTGHLGQCGGTSGHRPAGRGKGSRPDSESGRSIGGETHADALGIGTRHQRHRRRARQRHIGGAIGIDRGGDGELFGEAPQRLVPRIEQGCAPRRAFACADQIAVDRGQLGSEFVDRQHLGARLALHQTAGIGEGVVGDAEIARQAARTFDRRQAQRGFERVAFKAGQSGFESDEAGEHARCLDRAFRLAHGGKFRFGSRQRGGRIAGLPLHQRAFGTRDDAGAHPAIGIRLVDPDRAGKHQFALRQRAARVIGIAGIGDVLRRQFKAAARGCKAAAADREDCGWHQLSPCARS